MKNIKLLIVFLSGCALTFVLMKLTYSGDNVARAAFYNPKKLKPMFARITWDSVKAFSATYDASPMIREPDTPLAIGFGVKPGRPYCGFTIDSAGVNLIRDSLQYKQLYLRLGKRSDKSFTIMILPLDAKGEVIQSGSVQPGEVIHNYDNLEPCPDICPTKFR